jgi:hypothetical protein
LLVTFLPLPLFRVPRLRRRIADSTSLEALFDVLRREEDFAGEDLRGDDGFREDDLRVDDLRGAMLTVLRSLLSAQLPESAGGSRACKRAARNERPFRRP